MGVLGAACERALTSGVRHADLDDRRDPAVRYAGPDRSRGVASTGALRNLRCHLSDEDRADSGVKSSPDPGIRPAVVGGIREQSDRVGPGLCDDPTLCPALHKTLPVEIVAETPARVRSAVHPRGGRGDGDRSFESIYAETASGSAPCAVRGGIVQHRVHIRDGAVVAGPGLRFGMASVLSVHREAAGREGDLCARDDVLSADLRPAVPWRTSVRPRPAPNPGGRELCSRVGCDAAGDPVVHRIRDVHQSDRGHLPEEQDRLSALHHGCGCGRERGPERPADTVSGYDGRGVGDSGRVRDDDRGTLLGDEAPVSGAV